MTDETERPEDTIRRYAGQIEELKAWKLRYKEAAELWDALNTKENDQVTGALLIGKLYDFKRGLSVISLAVTDGVDWIDAIGYVETARIMAQQDQITPTGSDDDD